MSEKGGYCPEEIIAPVVNREMTPEELFKAHVEDVRRNGDLFDMRHTLKVPLSATAGGAAGTLGALTTHSEHLHSFAFGLVASSVVAAGAVCAGVKLFARVEAGKALRRHEDEHLAARKAIDAYYELYRTDKQPDGTRNVAMRWFGPIVNEERSTAKEEFTRILKLARDSGVATVLADPRAAISTSQVAPPGPRCTMAEWLERTKKVPTKNQTELDVVVEATPDEWLTCIESIPPTTETHVLKGTREKIGDYDPQGILKLITPTIGKTQPSSPVTLYVIDPKGEETITVRRIVKEEPIVPIYPYSVQESIAAKKVRRQDIGKIKFNPKRIVAGLILGALAGGVGVGAAQYGADELLRYREHQAADQIARENGVDPSDANVDPEAIRQRVDSWSGVNRLWGSWRDARNDVHEWRK